MDDTGLNDQTPAAAETAGEAVADPAQLRIARALDQLDKAGFSAQRAYTNALLQVLTNPEVVLVAEDPEGGRDERGTEGGALGNEDHPAFQDAAETGEA